MKTFKAKKPRSKYKTLNSYLNAVYRNNKETIDKELGNTGKPQMIFKELVKQQMQGENINVRDALKTVARSTIFTSEVERLRENAWKGMTEDKSAYKAFRELTKVGGKYTKFDPEKLIWDRQEKHYVYDTGRINPETKKPVYVVVSFQNSPLGVKVFTP